MNNLTNTHWCTVRCIWMCLWPLLIFNMCLGLTKSSDQNQHELLLYQPFSNVSMFLQVAIKVSWQKKLFYCHDLNNKKKSNSIVWHSFLTLIEPYSNKTTIQYVIYIFTMLLYLKNTFKDVYIIICQILHSMIWTKYFDMDQALWYGYSVMTHSRYWLKL